MSSVIVKFVNTWKLHHQQLEQRLQALRQRDGEDCRRCRRPMRFDLSSGHDLAPKLEQVLSGTAEELENLCLTHRRCISEGFDHTVEVKERIRRRAEADLLSSSRRRRRSAAG